MANSRELVGCVAKLTGESVAKVTGYMRDLREADKGLITVGGRGPTAPTMAATDAAALLCAMYASPTVQGAAGILLDLKKMPCSQQTRRVTRKAIDDYRYEVPVDTLALSPDHDGVQAVASAIEFFLREDEFRTRYYREFGDQLPLFARFEIHSSQLYASLTLGVRGKFADIWTYGRKGALDSRKIQQCSEVTLRALSACLEAP